MDNYTPDPFNTAQNQTDNSQTAGNNSYNNQQANVNTSYNDYSDIYSQPANNTNTGTANTYANNTTYNNGTYQQGYNNTYNNGAYQQGYNNTGYNNTYNNGAYQQGYNNAGYNNTYNNGTYQYGYNNTGYMNYQQPIATNFPSYGVYLTLSILSIIFTCWPAGIVAVVQTTGANTAFKNGDAFTYQKKRKNAKIALIVGLCYFIFYIALSILLAMM